MIVLENITFKSNPETDLERTILDNFYAEIHNEDFITVMGGNGAGKSTLMNIVAGNIPVTSGKIWVDGKNVTNQKDYKRASWISRVFQDPLQGCCKELTVFENLLLAYKRGEKRFLNFSNNKKLKSYFTQELASFNSGLESKIDAHMENLSGGQRQCVSLLMATIKPSKILLLDEHTAALDPLMAQKVLDYTQKRIEEMNLTTLMITHSSQEAKQVGNRLWILQNGKLSGDFNEEIKEKILVCEKNLFENLYAYKNLSVAQ